MWKRLLKGLRKLNYVGYQRKQTYLLDYEKDLEKIVYIWMLACLFATRNVATKCYSFKNTYLQTLPNTIFQQDQYLANHTLQFLQTSGKEIINRPVRSPDLSPTENVWDGISTGSTVTNARPTSNTFVTY
jgi:hypothetical protein